MLVRKRLGEVPGLKAYGPRISRKTHRSTFSGKLAATKDATAPPIECPTKENLSQPRDLAWTNKHNRERGGGGGLLVYKQLGWCILNLLAAQLCM